METDRRLVTILFTDIVGSTTLAEKLDPEEWREIVQGAHRRVTTAVTRYEGSIAQLLGDGVLAYFGAPVAHEDDPARAVRAALDIQRAIQAYALDLRGFVEDFRMRVGVHTGPVVVGSVGTSEHSEYLAVGDSVNLAARLQSAAEPGTILLSDVTARLVQPLFELRELGEVTVKGKAEPVRVWQAVAPRAGVSSARGILGLVSPLVGRRHEFELLQNALQEVRAGRGQIVAITGEPGIGKSRLVEELRRQTEDEGRTTVAVVNRLPSSVRFLEGRALSYGQALPFWTIIQLLQDDLGLGDGEPEIRIRIAIGRRVKELFGEKSDEVLPYLAHLLGIQPEGDAAERLKGLDGETIKHQVLVSVSDYFSKLAAKQPTVLVFEDLHWADPSSLEALERLLRLTRRAPVMLVLLLRREKDKPVWRLIELAGSEYANQFTDIKLESLSPSDSQELVGNLLTISELPDGIRNLILERAEGNPFFLEEIIRNLIEQGAITRKGDSWHAQSSLSTLHIPDTLQALLLARIDRLQDDVKRTLQLASVIGRTFLYKLLEAISEAERELDWHLAQLERADLVLEKAQLPELEYMFKHSLTQEAAYDSLLYERRREFHRRVAIALTSLFSEREDDLLGLLAYHFDRAGEKEKAIEFLIRAGDKTRLSDAHTEAIQFYQRAIDLLHEIGNMDGEAKTWLKLGLIYHANFDFEEAHEANERAFALHSRARRVPPDRRGVRTPSDSAHELCIVTWPNTLDPGQARFEIAASFIGNLFAGLVEIDNELNVVPHCAKSWQVLEGGTRYLFHLRDDVRWTNGEQVTSADFEWAWKRNLRDSASESSMVFDSIVGAHEFRLGHATNPDSVGVRALDARTLEVRLVEPSSYFPYVLGLPISFPLPRATVERYGTEWCSSQNIVSNGAFRVLESDNAQPKLVLVRNHGYFGDVHGNVERVRLVPIEQSAPTEESSLLTGAQFLTGNVNLVWGDRAAVDPSTRQPLGSARSPVSSTTHAILNPFRPPLDDVRVRRALLHALDRESIVQVLTPSGVQDSAAYGGLIPPAMAGHSPGIGLEYDLDTARQLLVEVGFPKGKGFPTLVVTWPNIGPWSSTARAEVARQWREGLGIEIKIQGRSPEITEDVQFGGWTADYPDPDTFLRVMLHATLLNKVGWHDDLYFQLVDEAAHTPDRARRLALYRQADRYLVAEQALVYPRGYGNRAIVAKPWLKDCKINPLGWIDFKNIIVEPH